jgi:biopolymer transport protein TolR
MAVEFTPRQRAHIRKRTRVVELDPSEMVGELNIVPFLDIVVNLIMFLLATTAAVLAISEIEAQLPTTGRAGRRGADTGQSLNLNVTVTDMGVIVAGARGKLAPGCENTATGRVITVPKLGGKYDWAGLSTCLAKVKEAFPDETQVILQADPTIEYEHVIATMDAVRARGKTELFPDLLLSAGVR